MAGTYGITAYQQTNGAWNTKQTQATKNDTNNTVSKTEKESKSEGVKIIDFKPLDLKNAQEIEDEVSEEQIDDKEYVEIDAPTMESLINQVSKYAYDSLARNAITDEEKKVGQNFDFKG